MWTKPVIQPLSASHLIWPEAVQGKYPSTNDHYCGVMVTSSRITLASRPTGTVTNDNFGRDEVNLPALQDGEILVVTKYLSVDPAMRAWMQYDTYLPKIELNDVVRAVGAGEVVETRNEAYPVGTRVVGMVGWQTSAVLNGAFAIPNGVSYQDALSVLGTTGLTAYVGMMDIGKPKAGQTVVVSGAAGAVGSVAGQIARIQGSRVVGIAGGPEKCRWVTEDLGFDECIDYKSEDVRSRLMEACPDGIDVYFDNVGGEILNTALGQINNFSRIVLCGAISGYNSPEAQPGPANLSNAIVRRATLRGFIVLDHFDRAKEVSGIMAGWLADGSLQSEVTVTDGFENAPEAFEGLFSGGNTGKALVRLQ